MTYAATFSANRVRAASVRHLYPGALGLGAAPVLAANGGYFSTSWGWAGAAFAWATVLAAAFGETWRPTRRELAFVGGLLLFVLWTALAMAWTRTQSATMLELERSLLYLAAALAVLAVVRREHARQLIAGIALGLGAITLYALSTRLFPHGNVDGG